MFRENTPYIPYTLLYKIMHRLHHCILYLSSSLLATFYTLSFHQLTLLTLLTLLTYINLLNLQYIYIYIYIYIFYRRFYQTPHRSACRRPAPSFFQVVSKCAYRRPGPSSSCTARSVRANTNSQTSVP